MICVAVRRHPASATHVGGRGAAITTRIFRDDRQVAEQGNNVRWHWRSLITYALLGAGLGSLLSTIYVAYTPPLFEATALADVRRLGPDPSSSIFASVADVSAAANSSASFEEVISDLDLAETVSELRTMVVVKPLFGNPAVRVTVTDMSADHAEEIARGFVRVMEDMPVPELLSDGPDYRITLRESSETSLVPTSPKPSHDIVSGGFLGFALGLVAYTARRVPIATKRGARAK
jgi:hypothetical protein